RVIDWRIPLGILLSLTAFTGAFWLANPEKYASPLFHILAGGLLIGAFFMATDMVTSLITPLGTWIYALGIANSKEREGGRVIARSIPVITADPSRRE
ncbi:unnamed protein product, partial [marine sediment metagenome]